MMGTSSGNETESLPERIRRELRRCWETVAETVRIYGEIDGEQRAASFAYYVLFSLFPLFALILTVGSSFFSSQEVIQTIREALPLTEDQQDWIWSAVAALERSRGSVSIISVVILLWCSLRFFQALVRGVNRAWHTIELPWWQVPLKNLMMIAIVASALFAGLLAPALLQGVRKAISFMNAWLHLQFPQADLILLSRLIDLSRYFIGGAVLFYSFCMLYMLAPRRRITFHRIWIPSLLVTLALQVCQIAFVNYLPRFVNYGIYGAVGGLMLLLLWVYFSGIIIMLGGCMCAAVGRVFFDDDDGGTIRTSS